MHHTFICCCILIMLPACAMTKPHEAVEFEARTEEHESETVELPQDADPAARDETDTLPPSNEDEKRKSDRSNGAIERSALLNFLANGPAHLLQQVEVEPVLDGKRFIGFRMVSLSSDTGQFRPLDLMPGDIVTAVNGQPIERPEQFFAVWEQLPHVDTITIDVLRNNRHHLLLYEIVD